MGEAAVVGVREASNERGEGVGRRKIKKKGRRDTRPLAVCTCNVQQFERRSLWRGAGGGEGGCRASLDSVHREGLLGTGMEVRTTNRKLTTLPHRPSFYAHVFDPCAASIDARG